MKKAKDLLERTIVNGISVVILVILIVFANSGLFRWVFTGAVALIQAVALWEYFQLVKQKGMQPAIRLGIVASILYVFASFLKTQTDNLWTITPEVVLALTFLAFFIYFAFRQDQPILNISSSFFGILYITVPLALIIRIVYFFKNDLASEGSFWLIYLIAVTKSADTAAFFVGRAIGKIKLASKLSPNKTLEGAIGGLIASIAVSLIMYSIGKGMGLANYLSLGGAALLGFIIGIAGQLGDLAESLLKRDAKIKDSNRIPGVGGVLDMMDSILFTSPIIFIFLKVYTQTT